MLIIKYALTSNVSYGVKKDWWWWWWWWCDKEQQRWWSDDDDVESKHKSTLRGFSRNL